jgi:hypothetical protein
MAREIINVGSTPNDGQGDPIRTAFIKTNNNFGELYSKIQLVPPAALTGSVGDTAGMTAYDQEYYYYCFANYNGVNVIWRQVPNAAQANVGIISATGNVTSNGNVAASYFIGDGSQLTNVIAGAGEELINGNTNITTAQNGNANITIDGTSNVAVFYTGGLIVNQSIDALRLTTTANVRAANMKTDGFVTAAGNVTAGNVLTGGFVSATGNSTSGNLLTSGIASAAGTGTFGNVYTTGEISAAGNIYTATTVSATGNVIGNYIIGDGGYLSNVTVTSNVAVSQIANGTSILSVNGSGGNILVNIGGISNVAQFVPNGIEVTGNVNSANIYLTGRLVSAGNVTGGNLLATNNVVATGNVKGTHVNSDLTMSAVGNILGGNLRTAGTVSATGNVSGNYFIGNGSQLTDITSSYGNSNVEVYLSSYSGNITANIISATGNVTGGNVVTAGVVNTTGNIFGNIVSATGNVNASNVYIAGQQVVVGNVTGGNLNSTIDISATGNVKAGGVTSYSFISAVGTITSNAIVSNSTVSAVGNITANVGSYFIGNGSQLTGVTATGIGTLASLSVTGNTTTGNLLTGGIISATGNVSGSYFVGTATSAQYADVAENYTSDNDYEPGTVLEFGGSAEVTIASDETPRVAGIVSTNPAHLMNSMLTGKHTVALALLGRVPCKVRGNVAKGDMLISAGDGYARTKQNPVMGTVIGKALEASSGDHSVIEVVVGRL